MPLIKTEFAQSIGTITLDNPAKRNALCATLIEDLIAALAGLEREKARAVVFRAAQGVKGVAIRWDGTIPCATWCARLKIFPPRCSPWLKAACGAARARWC
jgi:hypothetical protein